MYTNKQTNNIFVQESELAVQYAKALDCRRITRNYHMEKIHLMVGRVPAGADRCTVAMEMEDTFVQNLKHAAGRHSGIDRANQHQDYRSTIFPRLPTPSCSGSPESRSSQHQDADGHIHIAQVPDRHEPDSDGELSFSNLFKLLEELDYQDYIGWEYKPQQTGSQQARPEVVAGGVDDRLQMVVHGDQLRWRTAAGLRLRRCSVRVQTTCLVFLFQSNLSRKVIVLSSEQQSTIVLRSRVRTGSVDTEPDNINTVPFKKIINT
ncbi:hypothetical protein cypCar_00045122 [Cyprinus carpio]|nr:hypothetical protein cypCar_00045122 [Cyprinus carpio]